ncbi:MAG: fluoride efflux transporter CrcB [Micropepsaceae bacterium]
MPWLAVAAGGALGAVARYAMAGAVQRVAGGAFPWGTLAVNILGALLMGVVVEGSARLWNIPADLRLFLTTGILGGFTTFSAFSLETALIIEKGDWMPAIAYIAASVALTVLFLFCGMWAVRSFAG